MDLSCLSSDVAFMPHGHCYYWTPELLWLMVGSDIAIGLSYFFIAGALAYFTIRRSDAPFPTILRLFGAFILACGATHFVAAANTWSAAYWLEGGMKFFTAAVSVWTAIVLFPAIPTALAMSSPAELEAKNAELKAANGELARLNERLAAMLDTVKDTNAELDRKNDDLDAKNRELDRVAADLVEAHAAQQNFVENITHEFRTPLNRVVVPAALVGSRHADNPAIRGAMDDVLAGASDLERLVERLLQHARIDRGAATVSRAAIDCEKLLRGTLDRWRPRAEAQGVTMDFEADDERTLVALDPFFVDRIACNLIDNALRHGASSEGDRVRVAWSWREGVGTLTVEDSGRGIPEDEREAVFGRFVRGREARDAHRRGTGLGLSIVREFAELLDGSVHMETSPLGGARFVVELPAEHATGPEIIPWVGRPAGMSWPASPQTHAAADPADGEQPHRGERRILVAEDDPDLARLMAALLSELGTVELVGDGEAAWERLLADPPDVLVADVRMPRLDGLTLCERLRERDPARAIPVILVTARSGREVVTRAWDAGADDFVVKPFHPQELVLRVRSLADGARARRTSAAADRALAAAQRTNQELERLALALSHDFHGPLLGLSRLMGHCIEDLEDGDPDSALEMLRPSHVQAERLSASARDLLHYCRFAWANHPDAHVDIGQRVRAAAELSAAEGGPRLELDVDELEGRLAVAPFELVVRNLVSNAVKHHHQPTTGVVRVSLAADGPGRVVLSVEDDGPGIPEAMHAEVFRMFRRGKTEADGTGVGLSLVATLVERHGADISIDSELGRGSRFTVQWPLLAPSTTGQEEAA